MRPLLLLAFTVSGLLTFTGWPASWLYAPVLRVNESAAQVFGDAASAGLDRVPWVDGSAAALFAALAALLGPGLVCAAAVWIAAAGAPVRVVLAAVVVVAALGSFVTTGGGDSGVVSAAAVLLAFLVALAGTYVLSVPLVAAAGAVAGGVVAAAVSGSSPALESAVHVVSAQVGGGSYVPVVLGVVAMLPVGAACGRLVSR